MKEKLKTFNFSKNQDLYILILILFIAFLTRIFFYNGIVFSDDSYYNQLAISLLQGNFAENYLGYPIFLLRKMEIVFTAFSFFLFGINETSSVLFPFVLSVSSIVLVYKFALVLFEEKKIGLLAAFLYAFFPPDIIFATINFTDLQCAFFINLGLYSLLKAHKESDNKWSMLSGLFFSLSLLIKESLLFVIVLLVGLQIYLFIKNRSSNRTIIISLLIVVSFIVIEGLFYYFSAGKLEYRIYMLAENYRYCYYDFFPYTVLGVDAGTGSYLKAIAKQVFVLNPKYLFARRYYLGLPILALVQAILLIKEKREKLLTYWGVGIMILLLSLSTSFTDYKPFDLKRSWYIFIGVMPIMLLAAQYLSRFRLKYQVIMLSVYLVGSIIMSYEYQKFFNMESLNSLKNFVKLNDDATIYTDHHTKYGLDVIRGEGKISDTKIIMGKYYNLYDIPRSAFVIYNRKEIDELLLQGYVYPEFTVLDESGYSKTHEFGKFIIYQKN
ncbi:MAG: glycosyltransferase family 39 protein [Bacteroidetes bacterium]|nr:glycosyltransferase family 39 protein [Bacteroidota bacterium]